MQLNHAHCIYIKKEEEVLPAKFFILICIMLIFSYQEVDFPKITYTVSNRGTEAMGTNQFKTDKVPLNLEHRVNTSLNYVPVSFIFFFKFLLTVIETLQKLCLDDNWYELSVEKYAD